MECGIVIQMGRNFRSACHKCKVQLFHYRGDETRTLHQFYKDHDDCMRIRPSYVETLDDQMQEENWMDEYADLTLDPESRHVSSNTVK